MFSKVYHEFKELPLNTDSSHVMLHLEAPSVLDKGLPPKNFIFVIDTSSSMSGEKIKRCKDLIGKGMRLFRDCDKIALVSYAEQAEMRSDWTPCTSEGKAKLYRAFKSLTPNGCTNMSGGLFKACELCTKQTDVTIVFLTDGHANRGVQDSQVLHDMLKKVLGDSNVRIHTLGVGNDHNVDMLQKLCLGGTYTFVENAEDTTKAFGSVLGSAYSTYYQNIKIEISGTNMNFTVVGNAITEYDVGDLYAEEKKDFLAKAHFAKEGPYKVTWHITGVNIVDQSVLDKTMELVIERGEDNTKNEAIENRLNEITASSVITRSLKLARQGKFNEAKRICRGFKTNDPILSRVMNTAEESMEDVDAFRGGVNRVTSLAAEVLTQRGTSETISTPWQRKVADALDSNQFQ